MQFIKNYLAKIFSLIIQPITISTKFQGGNHNFQYQQEINHALDILI